MSECESVCVCLNSHTTRDIIFQSGRGGGLGVPNIEWIYTASRTGHLLNMLNNDSTSVRELVTFPTSTAA